MGGSSQVQHLGTIGRLGEVEGGSAAVPRLWERQAGSELRGALGTCFATPPTPPPALAPTHPPVCAAWLGKQQRPPAKSLCSHQSRHLSCGCHKPQVQTAQPPPADPAQGSSPRSHPCRGQADRRRGGLGTSAPQPWGRLGPTGASPEGVVALHHEAAEGSVVAPVEGSRCLGRASNLPDDVPRPPEALLAHQLTAGWGRRGVSSHLQTWGDRVPRLRGAGGASLGDWALTQLSSAAPPPPPPMYSGTPTPLGHHEDPGRWHMQSSQRGAWPSGRPTASRASPRLCAAG